jgi:hypothetical protein
MCNVYSVPNSIIKGRTRQPRCAGTIYADRLRALHGSLSAGRKLSAFVALTSTALASLWRGVAVRAFCRASERRELVFCFARPLPVP